MFRSIFALRIMDKTQRTLRARIGAYSLHATHDSREITANARTAAFTRFVDEVDPSRVLPEGERLRRAECARRAHMTRIALKSVAARQKKAAGGTAASKGGAHASAKTLTN